MILKILDEQFTVCKVKDYHKVDMEMPFVFIGSTDEEKSLICSTEKVPDNTTEREDGWKAFCIEGVLGFSLIGILADISSILAEGKIGIIAVSTFNTDYILTKFKDFEKAIKILKEAGYKVKSDK